MPPLDHLPFAARDVEHHRAVLGRLGFRATATGTCRFESDGRPQQVRCISVMFEQGYLDVIESGGPRFAARLARSPLYAGGAAPSGIVLGATSKEALAELRAATGAAGLQPTAPYEIVRSVAGADPCEMHYWIFSFRSSTSSRGTLSFAAIHDAAPRALRRPQWLAHPNTATHIARLHVRVPSLPDPALAGLVSEADRSSEVAMGRGSGNARGGTQLDLGAAQLVLHEDARANALDGYLASVASSLPDRTRPALLAVELGVEDLAAARACLEASRTAFEERDARIAVTPTSGFGCGVVFGSA